jgi:hypothetical protein
MRGRHIFALVVIMFMGALAASLRPGTTQAQLPATFTPIFVTATPFLFTEVPLPTPTPLITPSPTSAAPGCVAAFPIQPGDVVTVRGGVNIRTAPSVSAPWLANFPEPRNFTALEGPVCVDDYFWWRIRGHGVSGWVAERSNAMTFITFIDPVATAVVCPRPLQLAAGEEVELVTGVRVRGEPSLAGRVLTVAPLGSMVTIVTADPTCADGYNWRRVRVTVAGWTYEGWMVEASSTLPDVAFIEITPETVCLLPLALSPGDRGRVTYRDGMPKNLRSAPGENGEILWTLVRAVPLEIIGGPVCLDGMNWWNVRILSTIPAEGWLAEGGPRGNYWITRAPIGAGSIPTVTPLPTRPS